MNGKSEFREFFSGLQTHSDPTVCGHFDKLATLKREQLESFTNYPPDCAVIYNMPWYFHLI